jgi:thiol:disulfide interchange protein
MKKRFFYFLIPLILLACNFITGQRIAPLPTSPEPASIQPTTLASEAHSSKSFTISRINIQNGDLVTQLAEQAQKAKSLNQTLFIEFDATWCPPCQAIDASVKAEDPLTLKAFQGIYLVRADVDEWGWGDGEKFNFEAIPIYYRLDYKGNPTGASIDGGAWNEDIPKNFAPVLDLFFHTP